MQHFKIQLFVNNLNVIEIRPGTKDSIIFSSELIDKVRLKITIFPYNPLI